ncbi:MAG: hypothetical protein ACREJG_01205, partial [Candidatus Rokuibacteriota bacterium]
MRMAVRKLEVGDAGELVRLVTENIDGLEPGLTVLDSRLLLGHATIDVVAVDATGTLVLVALGRAADEVMLMSVVEAYSWCLEYPEAIQRLYPTLRLSADRPPRVIFVVERMPDSFQRKMKQLNFQDVVCVEFRHIEVNGVAAVLFDRVAHLDRPVAPAPNAAAAAERNSHAMPSRNGHALNGHAAAAENLQSALEQAIASAATRLPEAPSAATMDETATGLRALLDEIAKGRLAAVEQGPTPGAPGDAPVEASGESMDAATGEPPAAEIET